MTVVFEPASAIAAGICLTARAISDRREGPRHDRPCGWCDYTADELQQLIDGFNAWAGWSERSRTYQRHDARVFQDLPRAEQAALVLAAQAFPPLEAATPPPADADEEVPTWMRQP